MLSELFKDIRSGVSRVLTSNRILIVFFALITIWLLTQYSGVKFTSVDAMETGTPVDDATAPPAKATDVPVTQALGPIANPNELLPVDQNSQWAALNPVNMAQGNILNGDMLQAGYHIGLDTIGQSMKNANLQLRSDPIIPKQDVGPWNQSTYEPDYARVPLEVGYGPANCAGAAPATSAR
uniref:Minor capsid protein P11 C-terminal conserved region domain-containing protein n=1 Tax=viral metagenome TaxID=1070528 RepID=A0A6C0B5H8_9ZZZZ